MALRSSAPAHQGDHYVALTSAFCDGFEVCVANVKREVVESKKLVLLDSIQSHLQEVIIKNMLVVTRK